MQEPTVEALKILRQTHDQGCLTLKSNRCDPEGFAVAVEVEKHRWFWKPRRPRLVLVAESHVHTTEHDMGFRINGDTLRQFLSPNTALPPDRFVRLVYCLGYGESDLLRGPMPLQGENSGTPTYWDIFGRVAFRCPQPRQEDGAKFNHRMRWKVETLREMYRMGIWLLDASVHAIFRRGLPRLSLDIQRCLHHQWRGGYGRHLLNSCPEAKIWVVGKSVFDSLNGLAEWSSKDWIYQPNTANYESTASAVDLNRNWPRLLKDCWSLRSSLND